MIDFDTHKMHFAVAKDDCSECKINEDHIERCKEARAVHGELLPSDVLAKLHEDLRQVWCQNLRSKISDDGKAVVKHDKSAKLMAYIDANPGKDVTLELLMEMGEAADGTVYAFLKNQSARFRKLGRGLWEIRDRVAEMAAERDTIAGATMDSPASRESPGPTVPFGNSESARSALAQFTGHQASRGNIGKP